MSRSERVFVALLVAVLITVSYVNGTSMVDDYAPFNDSGAGFGWPAIVLFIVTLLVSLRLVKRFSDFVRRYK